MTLSTRNGISGPQISSMSRPSDWPCAPLPSMRRISCASARLWEVQRQNPSASAARSAEVRPCTSSSVASWAIWVRKDSAAASRWSPDLKLEKASAAEIRSSGEIRRSVASTDIAILPCLSRRRYFTSRSLPEQSLAGFYDRFTPA